MLGLVRLLSNQSDLGDEFGARPCAARGAIVCGDTCSRCGQLSNDRIERRATRQCSGELQNAHRKMARALGQLIRFNGHSEEDADAEPSKSANESRSVRADIENLTLPLAPKCGNFRIAPSDLAVSQDSQILKSSNPQI